MNTNGLRMLEIKKKSKMFSRCLSVKKELLKPMSECCVVFLWIKDPRDLLLEWINGHISTHFPAYKFRFTLFKSLNKSDCLLHLTLITYIVLQFCKTISNKKPIKHLLRKFKIESELDRQHISMSTTSLRFKIFLIQVLS